MMDGSRCLLFIVGSASWWKMALPIYTVSTFPEVMYGEGITRSSHMLRMGTDLRPLGFSIHKVPIIETKTTTIIVILASTCMHFEEKFTINGKNYYQLTAEKPIFFC